MRIVVALGGNALLKRGEPMTAENQRANIRIASEALAPIAEQHDIVITHGNGPQVGLLALQAAAYRDLPSYPLDVLGSQTEGMIGYVIMQELGNLLPYERPFATLLTQVEVDPDDPAFANPTKPIGPVYSQDEADAISKERGWSMAPDGDRFRRVVPSPRPKHIFEIRVIKMLVEKNVVVICAGGGGIPTMYLDGRKLVGVEAVIDKDLASALLARELGADYYMMLTDVDAVVKDWGTDTARSIRSAGPGALKALKFAEGSMGPKVQAACEFVEATGCPAAVGTLRDAGRILEGGRGTIVRNDVNGLEFYD
jgi:carbamate kinase